MEWAAFYELEPWGTEADDAMQAHVCQLIAATNTVKGPRPKLDDFLLFQGKPANRRQSPAEMLARARAMTAWTTNNHK